MSEAPLVRGDNEPIFFHPYTKGVNPRLVQPTYQRYIGTEARFFNAEQKAMALERQGYTCPICFQSIDMHDSESHHCVQFQAQGSSSLDNLVVVHRGSCHRMADAMGLANKDLIVGGTIYDAEPSQFRAGHKPPMYTKPPSF